MDKAKRPLESPGTTSGRDKRRARQKDVRQIGRPRNALDHNAPKVGGVVNPEQYVAARIDEIRAMQSAIKSASNALTCLTMQALPRDMRRRAASHDLNRLPAHLRERAARERAEAPPTKRKIKKGKRKAKTDNVVKEYLRRQKENKWLETHMWHTKRMKMTNIWGYRLATNPNIKSARSIYRAFQHTVVAHDASYTGCLEITGKHSAIVTIVNHLSDVSFPSVGSERFNKGNRMGHTYLYEYNGCPAKCICPVTFLWKSTEDVSNDERKLWIWIHPSAFEEAFQAFESARAALPEENIKLTDLRDQLSLIDLSGSTSTSLLQAILKPIEENSGIDQGCSATLKGSQIWRQLACLRSSSSLSPGSVIGLTVQDPRLTFPQKLPRKPNNASAEAQSQLEELITNQLPLGAAYSDIWNDQKRQHVQNEMQSEHALNKRREKLLLPGTKLDFTPEDAKVSVLLVQRGSADLQQQNRGRREKHHSACTQELLSGWRLIVPRGWGLPFWKSMVFAGARPAGFQDLHAMHFESKQPYFPYDIVGTRAWDSVTTMAKNEAESAWKRKPPAKRLNYAKLNVARPFDPAFDVLTKTTMPITAQDQNQEAGEQQLSPPRQRPGFYLLHSERAISAALGPEKNDQAATAAVQAYFEDMYAKRKIKLSLASLNLNNALIAVRVEYVDRGRPQPNAMIYMMNDEEEYIRSTHYMLNRRPDLKSKRIVMNNFDEDAGEYVDLDDANDTMEVDEDKVKFPPANDLIGHLTTGGFSFSAGYGFGLGACSVEGIRRLQNLDKSQERKVKMMVLVRNTNGLQCRPAQLYLVL